MLALFRLYEMSDGFITIDGVNTSEIGLHRLRRAIAIIPQVRTCGLCLRCGVCAYGYGGRELSQRGHRLGCTHRCRRAWCALVQDPVMFSGTIRLNLGARCSSGLAIARAVL
jgi:ABC-type multidrug transport system fused ATPase/permease subunit